MCDDDCTNSIAQRNEQNKGLINTTITSTTSSAKISGLSTSSNNKASYTMHYHVIILGSPNYASNHFGSNPYPFLDREINGNNKMHCSACECYPE